MATPPVVYAAVPANPLGGGLYDAASVVEAMDMRHIGGMVLEPVNEGSSGVWQLGGEDNPDKVGERGEWPTFPATTVWAADGVKTVGATADGARERAEQLLRLKEPVHVEEFVAAQLLEANAATSAATVQEQVAFLELELGKRGYPGVLHASRELLPALKDYIVRQGQALFTPGGHRWAFGGGYGALGSNIVATGAVTVVRSRLVEVGATDTRLNDYHAVAERVVAVGWEGEPLRAALAGSD